MKNLLLLGAMSLPLLTGCIQADTILVNAQASVPESAVKNAAGIAKDLVDSGDAKPAEEKQQEAEPPANLEPPVTHVKRKVTGVVRRLSGKKDTDLTVVITHRFVGADSPIVATGSVDPDGNFEMEAIDGDFSLFVTKGGVTNLIQSHDGRLLLTFSTNTTTSAPQIDISISKDLEVPVGFALITVMEWFESL